MAPFVRPRGPHAAWRYGQESWEQASLGLGLSDRPQAVITTTPRPSTYDNVANLADAFIRTIVKRYEGTRLGRQELNADTSGERQLLAEFAIKL